MRDPTVNANAAAEAKRVSDAIESARQQLYWTLVSDLRWADSRWSGQDPRVEWEQGFYDAVKVARNIINDPACDSLLRKHAVVPGGREIITAALERACPRPRKKGELREQINSLRDQRIAEMVAATCNKRFHAKRGSATKDHERRESACSIVAQALRKLGFKLSEKRVEAIWDKHKKTYSRLLNKDLADT